MKYVNWAKAQINTAILITPDLSRGLKREVMALGFSPTYDVTTLSPVTFG
jgi:hypothetical protein